MNNKLNNMINEFLANTDAKDEKEFNKKLITRFHSKIQCR